ncbi:MAG: hypothetical protein Q8P48_04610, partial [Deltaproteobacteria bacterium]|nr:hypothetical protein [Deltaproteobacteria bacterium]
EYSMSMSIETIFTHTTDNGVEGSLGIDEHGKLYWNDKAVVTEQKITLQWWVNLSVIVASVSTLILAVIACLQFLGYGVSN